MKKKITKKSSKLESKLKNEDTLELLDKILPKSNFKTDMEELTKRTKLYEKLDKQNQL